MHFILLHTALIAALLFALLLRVGSSMLVDQVRDLRAFVYFGWLGSLCLLLKVCELAQHVVKVGHFLCVCVGERQRQSD